MINWAKRKMISAQKFVLNSLFLAVYTPVYQYMHWCIDSLVVMVAASLSALIVGSRRLTLLEGVLDYFLQVDWIATVVDKELTSVADYVQARNTKLAEEQKKKAPDSFVDKKMHRTHSCTLVPPPPPPPAPVSRLTASLPNKSHIKVMVSGEESDTLVHVLPKYRATTGIYDDEPKSKRTRNPCSLLEEMNQRFKRNNIKSVDAPECRSYARSLHIEGQIPLGERRIPDTAKQHPANKGSLFDYTGRLSNGGTIKISNKTKTVSPVADLGIFMQEELSKKFKQREEELKTDADNGCDSGWPTPVTARVREHSRA
eukprot:CFRG3452T1